MISVRVEEAEHFYEEDEDPKEVFATFDAAEKGHTAPPDARRGPQQWQVKLRLAIAVVLRRLAKVIEPSHVRSR
jgi:hypothetical protein